MGEILGEVDAPTQYVYFPTVGFISLVTAVKGKPTLEVGMVGREGMLGTQLVLGVESAPLHAVVQGAGTAWRIAPPSSRKSWHTVLRCNAGSIDTYS